MINLQQSGLSHRTTWATLRSSLLALLGLATLLALAGCGGGGGGADEAPPTRAADSEGGGMDDEGGGGGGGGGAPPGGAPMGPPMMGGAPQTGGMPGAAPAAPAAPAVPLDLAAAPPLYPTRAGDPFAPLDRPLPPVPTTAARPTTQLRVFAPIRPNIVVPPDAPSEPSLVQPPSLRTAGLLGGKAIIEQNGEQQTVWPGQRTTIDYNGQRQVVVVSVSGNGTVLRDVQTNAIYTAPYRQ